jgi:hypothetical protein
MAKTQSITSIPRSPQEDRHSRAVRYTIGFAIRLACLLSCVFLRGWFLIIPAVIAVGGPLVLVILANASTSGGSAVVERPGAIVRRTSDQQ